MGVPCVACGTWGDHQCVGRDPRLVRFVDPTSAREFSDVQHAYLDGLRERLINMRYGGEIDRSGICNKCGRPLDDHRLTWALDWYNTKLCPHGKPKDIPVPVQFDDPLDPQLY